MERVSPREFINNVLSGIAIAIVAGLIPNAILGELFKALVPHFSIFQTLLYVTQGIQFTVPLLIGALIAYKFNLAPLAVAVVTSAAFVGSGAAQFKDGAWQLVGIGDIINTVLTACIAVALILLAGDRFGSMSIIVLPTIIGGVSGLIGVFTLPYVRLITTSIGNMINSFTELQLVLMSILIAMVYSMIIISPLSTVAISLAIGIAGLAAGSASLGIVACEAVLVAGTVTVNRIGVPITIFLGGVKMMMPNMLRYPIILLPIVITAAVTGFFGSLIGISGTKESAGFGIIGLVGPINAFRFMDTSFWMSLLLIFVAFFVVPFITGYLVNTLLMRVLKIYDNKIFKFLA
ncbi:PTS transporter subunit IIC [Staphylococcus auricularis]|uniref:PTS sugar transporter subunit IIC n=1 Tax=Staphylococcus auricularis TaxID=29379 RepID=A0AAW7MFI9_9STAP|nr:PTS sugar transporter subunit IIC [Staphylococcus auricularis]MDC6327364.1 PTS sugar transporter subunit IIC [Staphylococcus auricularis]MDN4534063.1 PTS sugar transporter subunit IIC [Staphylococcus auricularis]